MYYKVLLFITTITVVFLGSCNKSAKEVTKVKPPKTEHVKKAGSVKLESYDGFYRKFHRDSVFQVSRIKFPMKGHYTDTVGDLHKWNPSNWIMHRSEIQMVDTSIYKIETRNLKDFKTELLYIEGGGFKVERKFRLINGKWYLVFYTDENL